MPQDNATWIQDLQDSDGSTDRTCSNLPWTWPLYTLDSQPLKPPAPWEELMAPFKFKVRKIQEQLELNSISTPGLLPSSFNSFISVLFGSHLPCGAWERMMGAAPTTVTSVNLRFSGCVPCVAWGIPIDIPQIHWGCPIKLPF